MLIGDVSIFSLLAAQGGRFAPLLTSDTEIHLDSLRMPNKDTPQFERHPPKNGVGW